jgi:hypothetical protein
MTEDEWLTSEDPGLLLNYLWWGRPQGDRKWRLFAVACCRRVWHLMTGESRRRAVEIAERFADGLASIEELEASRADAESTGVAVFNRPSNRTIDDYATAAARDVLEPYPRFVAQKLCSTLQYIADPHMDFISDVSAPVRREQRFLADLVRDIFGDPFRHTSLPAQDILAWNDSTLLKIAEAIYAERAFDRMPILHDALLDAGCADEALLSHCRNPEGHARGCWGLDAILGKS